MLRSIAEYWGDLKGAVHPEDVPVFERVRDHGFNLDFPPPAFIGDIGSAPIIILDNNGGFDPIETPREFPDAQAHDEFRGSLAAPGVLDPTKLSVSPYYCSRNYTRLLTSGTAALVNGVAYRSVNGRSNKVAALSKVLPSALFHQNWLRQAVLPLVERGERFLVVHRWSRWNGAADMFQGHQNAVFSAAPISKDLTGQELAAVKNFLQDAGLAQP